MRKLLANKLIIFFILSAIVYIIWSAYRQGYDEKYCSQFSDLNCPADRCKVGGSCPICEDIGCHPKNYDNNWPVVQFDT